DRDRERVERHGVSEQPLDAQRPPPGGDEARARGLGGVERGAAVGAGRARRDLLAVGGEQRERRGYGARGDEVRLHGGAGGEGECEAVAIAGAERAMDGAARPGVRGGGVVVRLALERRALDGADGRAAVTAPRGPVVARLAGVDDTVAADRFLASRAAAVALGVG